MIIRCGEYAQMGGVTTGLLNIKAFLPQLVTEKKKVQLFPFKAYSSEWFPPHTEYFKWFLIIMDLKK